MDQMLHYTADLSKRLEAVEKGENIALAQTIKTLVKDEVKNALEDKDQTEKRKQNLIAINIKESR